MSFNHKLFFCDILRFQNKPVPPFSSQALASEQEDLSLSQPEAAIEEPTEQRPPPPTNQIPQEPPARGQKSVVKILGPDISETSVTPTVQVAEQEDRKLPAQKCSTLSPRDTGHPENQTAISVLSLAQAPATATSLPSNAISSVPPVLTLPTEASHPEVELYYYYYCCCCCCC